MIGKVCALWSGHHDRIQRRGSLLSGAQPTCLLIADISGYTSYLAGVEIDHAQDIMADLVGTLVTALRPAFRLAKLADDAAFMHRGRSTDA